MYILYSWLKELVPALSATPQEVAEKLTTHSFETVIEREYVIDPNVTIVSITKLEPHPNADRLRLATVTDGTKEVRVVCGAPNIKEGDIVPYAPPGANVYDEQGKQWTIKEAKIRGVASPGMLASPRELGLSQSHDGILILPPDTPLGTPLSLHLPSDTILEADITPNRAHDCLSMRGLAREVAALYSLPMADITLGTLPEPIQLYKQFKLGKFEHTPAYLLLAFEGVAEGPTPIWMMARLLAMGAQTLSPIVDITNYVAFEMGNPTHAFDVATMRPGALGSRLAKPKERIHLLSEKEATILAPENLVITNNDKPIALAGIKGGQANSVTQDTKDVLIEVANFVPEIIQKSARQANIISEASQRFSKGVPYSYVTTSAARITHLVKQICGATIAGYLHTKQSSPDTNTISVRKIRAEQISGTQIDLAKAAANIQALGCAVEEKDPDTWHITPPKDRLDIKGEEDVVEEIIRLQGLQAIPALKPSDANVVQSSPKSLMLFTMRRTLVERGFTETYNYSFDLEFASALLGMNQKNRVELQNPPSSEQHALRASLLPGLVVNLAKNKVEFSRHIRPATPALFEIGHVYRKGSGGKVPGIVEASHLAAIASEDSTALEALMRDICTALSIPEELLDFTRHSEQSSMIISLGGETIGSISTMSDNILQKMKYPAAICSLEIDTGLLQAHMPGNLAVPQDMQTLSKEFARQFTPLPKYPSVFRDIALLVDENTSIETVQETIERVGGALVEDTDLFDEYQPAGTAQKSLAFHIEYSSPEKTLTDKEVDTIHQKITKSLQEIGAKIR